MSLLPIILAVHICLAIALFLPSLLLPFGLRTGVPPDGSSGRLTTTLLRLQGSGTLVIGAGLAITGVLLVVVLGTRVVEQPWLLIALTIYALDLVLAFAIQRPNLRRLLSPASTTDDETWRLRARRQRYVSYAMALL
ncbi:MAG: hypothetical protein ACHQ3P_10725, partial [Candidatus Limnocylindrales bacterium]